MLLRDGAAATQVATYLNGTGFGPSRLTVLEALGGTRERIRTATSADFALADVTSPVALGSRPQLNRHDGRAVHRGIARRIVQPMTAN